MVDGRTSMKMLRRDRNMPTESWEKKGTMKKRNIELMMIFGIEIQR